MVRKQQGFSLIELMIVVAIIAILAAIAIPLYMNYTSQAEGSEGYVLAGSAKSAIVAYYNDLGKWPTNNQAAGLANPGSISGKFVKSVTVSSQSNGSLVTVQFKSAGVAKSLRNKNLYLSSTGETADVKWVCQVDNSEMYQYVPSTCRNKH